MTRWLTTSISACQPPAREQRTQVFLLNYLLSSKYVTSEVLLNLPIMCWSTVNEDQIKRLKTIQDTMIKMILRIKDQYSFNDLNIEAEIVPINYLLNRSYVILHAE